METPLHAVLAKTLIRQRRAAIKADVIILPVARPDLHCDRTVLEVRHRARDERVLGLRKTKLAGLNRAGELCAGEAVNLFVLGPAKEKLPALIERGVQRGWQGIQCRSKVVQRFKCVSWREERSQ